MTEQTAVGKVAGTHKENTVPDYTLRSPELSASISTQGAELQSLKMADGLELLWQADPKVWARHAPHLFPIVGRLKNDTLRHEGKTYNMTPHGFARDLEFVCAGHSTTQCTMLLKDSEQTRARYPFAFELRITHALEGNTLVITYALRNPAHTELLASVGTHPAFNWPLKAGIERTAHSMTFERDEPAPIRRVAGGLIKAQGFPTPVKNRVLTLDDALFVDDVIIFDPLNSRALTYTAPGAPQIRVDFPDFPHLGIWTKPGAGFVCIEPWQGHASPEDFDGEFRAKPGVVAIAPQGERTWQYKVAVSPPQA
ncbi:MAG: aldose 1-epimerase family protein [Gammaproteobacteria bacterium]|nr:aldose 1-epimerase family protein [Gammaproteobacteria bacterium]